LFQQLWFNLFRMKTMMFTLLFLLLGCGGSVHSAQPPQPSVVFFGDSIFGAWNLETYFPGKPYVNGGMFGYRTDQLKGLLPDVLSGKKVCHGLDGNANFPLTCVQVTPPKTIVIMAAWNNFFQGDVGNSADDLQAMADMAAAKSVKVIICTVYAYDPAHPAPWMVPTGNAPVTFYDMWRTPLNNSIGLMHGVTFVDFSTLFDDQSDYTADGIHPNDAGYAQMRDLINQVL
jgi:lysophospholipase L1-like esterase